MSDRDEARGRGRRLPSGLELGVRMGAGMALLVFGGYALDRALGTSPWLLLTGAVLGALFVMLDLVRTARRRG